MTASLRDVFADTALVMQEGGLTDALTTDEHFCQAGFRAVLLEDPAAG